MEHVTPQTIFHLHLRNIATFIHLALFLFYTASVYCDLAFEAVNDVPSDQFRCNRTRVRISNSSWGIITDGPLNYTQNTHCEWLIKAPAKESIALEIKKIVTECSFDYLFVFDGSSSSDNNSVLLASFSGSSDPNVVLLARSGQMLIILYSDTNYALEGFVAEFSLSLCPLNCSSAGTCIRVQNEHLCRCEEGRSGLGCEIEDEKPKVRLIYHRLVEPNLGRVGHSAVKIGERIFIYGGYDLNNLLSDILEIDLTTSDVTTKTMNLPLVEKESSQDVMHWPNGRFGHAYANSKGGFFIHGGKTALGISNDLLFYNTIEDRWMHWTNSSIPSLVYHSMTVVHDGFFVFGGGTARGEFSHFLYKFQEASPNIWKIVNSSCCVKPKDLSLLGHTATYWEEKNALLIYGGLGYGSGRAPRISSVLYMFLIDQSVWVKIDHSKLSGSPPGIVTQRAFHSTNLFGNFLIIVGGYTHTHNQDETCYSSQVLIYNLECQIFLPQAPLSHHMGLFSHQSVVWNKQLLIIGGYKGFLNTYVEKINFPFSSDPKQSECHTYDRWGCSGNARCGWCPTDSQCYEKESGYQNCTTNLQTSECPGVCPFLKNCQSCVVSQCIWCSNQETCMTKIQADKLCLSEGAMSRSISNCFTGHEFKKGVIRFDYRHPPNVSFPDQVKTLTSTSLSLNSRDLSHLETPSVVRMRGSIVGVEMRYIPWKLVICASDTAVNLTMKTKGEEGFSVSLVRSEYPACHDLTWPSGNAVIVSPGLRIHFDLWANVTSNERVDKVIFGNQGSEKLGRVAIQLKSDSSRTLSLDNLRPYTGNGSCNMYENCLACTSDAICGWVGEKCISRDKGFISDEFSLDTVILNAEECTTCEDIKFCSECAIEASCEWQEEQGICIRRGHSVAAVTNVDFCPQDCYLRQNCSSCLESPGRCVWCEQKQECLLFSVYTSYYQFGQCLQWMDKPEQCNLCDKQSTCESCIIHMGCGWSYNEQGGSCSEGDFEGPTVPLSTQSLDTQITPNKTWAYEECPDIDECSLSIHDCHENATCVNTHGSYECICNAGFTGDGKSLCEQTCYYPCQHGTCSPDFECLCDLGWTGTDCSVDCGCHNHSFCESGVCDECQEWTTGEHCEFCVAGSFGDATDGDKGCSPCSCNNHGDETKGFCNNSTGECYCLDNTQGSDCSQCVNGYYGDPTDGKPCYQSCKGRSVLEMGVGHFGLELGSYTRKKRELRNCLWIIQSPLKTPQTRLSTTRGEKKNNNNKVKASPHQKIVLHIAQGFRMPCSDNAIEIYNGLPLVKNSKAIEAPLVASVCDEDSIFGSDESVTISVNSHIVTIILQHASPTIAFNASFHIEHEKRPRDNDPVIIKPPGKSYRNSSNFASIEVEQLYNGESMLSRFGHSIHLQDNTNVWIFGGFSLSHGPLNDVRHFNRVTQKWEPVTITIDPTQDSVPVARYFHGGTVTPSSIIIIHGGINENMKFLSDTWKFESRSSRWTKLCDGPTLGGHTVTTIYDQGSHYMVIIGGVNSNEGFSSAVYAYGLDPGSEHRCWDIVNTKGSKPGGIYAHSTVFHEDSGALYVFGGVTHELTTVAPSSRLYVLQWRTKAWSILSPMYDNQIHRLPLPKTFHSAVSTNSFMVVLGGTGAPKNGSLMVYVYKCNLWMLLKGGGVDVKNLHSVAGAAALVEEDIVTMGGWKGSSMTSESLFKISIPEDICSLHNQNENRCKATLGCSFCSAGSNEDTFMCYSSDRGIPRSCVAAVIEKSSNLQFLKGTVCSDEWIESTDCSQFGSCSECVASWPSHSNVSQPCQWCNCKQGKGKCVPAISDCRTNGECSSTLPTFNADRCPENICSASSCNQCTETGKCAWTRQISRSRELSWELKLHPVYDWNCVRKSLLDNSRSVKVISAQAMEECPNPCWNIDRCDQCLESSGAEGGFHQCYWSVSLKRCFSPAHAWILCFGGNCGPVLNKKRDASECPQPCSSFTSCSKCLEFPSCGWCASEGENGIGKCLSASSSESSSCAPSSWNYLTCPKENECINGHHTCNPVSEDCIDMDIGFMCQCRQGYEKIDGVCEPICLGGCVHGHCASPGKCECHFGYVGHNCTHQCQCNGHSHCAGVDQLDNCTKCKNNTMGPQCSRCKPLFVGDPRNNGVCVPCVEYCNGHTTVCLDLESFKSWCSPNDVNMFSDPFNRELDLRTVASHAGPGPSGTAYCCLCKNNTRGSKCDDCLPGYFRGSDDKRYVCRKCECRGHSEICDPITGSDCNCQNNTESEHCSSSAGKQGTYQCWKHQCSKCREYYLGSPSAEGHQCYRQMHVDTDYCFDPNSQESCLIKPKPLLSGRTVFFAVQPKFMNVNIRINIDVTHGAINFFLSPKDDTFLVTQHEKHWAHKVEFDTKYGFGEKVFGGGSIKHPHVRANITMDHINNDGSILFRVKGKSGFQFVEQEAAGFHTFYTVMNPKSVLVVRNLRNRLVITLPQDTHDLRLTRFYVVLEGIGDVSYGSVFFRQDQLHIDLFVFFSVFFSAFFLFLAGCGIAWKIRQNVEARRARHRQLAEILSMAKRPFGVWTIMLEPETSSPLYKVYFQCRKSCRKGCICLRPVAIENTSSGSEAVYSMFITLAGGSSAPVRLCIGSTFASTNTRVHPPMHIRRRRLT